jgi:pimeloyl-ACP methyl ester carboxylesterase
VPSAVVDGIETRYELIGSGPPLLMYAPGGFDATVEKWSTQGVYATIKLLDHLPQHYTCVAFDRRETGASGGRVERVAWSDYARQGKALLDHLGVERAHVMGGCMGVSCAIAFAVAYPRATLSAVLYWPVGGARYRMSSSLRFAEHLAFVQRNGLEDVVQLVRAEGTSFGAEPRGGPWAAVIKRDPAFADGYARLSREAYMATVAGMGRTLFDRDTAPGAEPEDLLTLGMPALVVPGRDAAHATSAARYLEECLPRAQYWDVPVDGQTEATVPARILEFLAETGGG